MSASSRQQNWGALGAGPGLEWRLPIQTRHLHAHQETANETRRQGLFDLPTILGGVVRGRKIATVCAIVNSWFSKGGTMTRSALVRAVSIAAFAVSCLAAGADTNVSGATPLSEEQRVAALEDKWLDAEVTHDEATLRRVIGDRYTMNHSDGTTSGKEEYIADILSGTMLSASITERTVLVEGDTAVTFGTVNVVDPPVDGKDSGPRSARYTLVYVKRDGQWQALAFHIGKRSDK
jgi:hypothetical protein